MFTRWVKLAQVVAGLVAMGLFMPENTVKVVREFPQGGRSEVATFPSGPGDTLEIETDKDTGFQTVVLYTAEAEATDPVMLKTQETVRSAPSTDKKMAEQQLASEGGVHQGVDPDGEKVDEKAPGAQTAALPTGPDGVADETQTKQQGGTVERGSLQKAQKEQEAAENTAV